MKACAWAVNPIYDRRDPGFLMIVVRRSSCSMSAVEAVV